MLHYHRNTVKPDSYVGNSRNKIESGCCQVSNSRNTVKFRSCYVSHSRNTVKFLHSIVKLLETSEFNSCRKTHQLLVITECQTTTRNIWLTQTEKNLPKNLSSHIAFINGGVNFEGFALKEHTASDCHKIGLE